MAPPSIKKGSGPVRASTGGYLRSPFAISDSFTTAVEKFVASSSTRSNPSSSFTWRQQGAVDEETDDYEASLAAGRQWMRAGVGAGSLMIKDQKAQQLAAEKVYGHYLSSMSSIGGRTDLLKHVQASAPHKEEEEQKNGTNEPGGGVVSASREKRMPTLTSEGGSHVPFFGMSAQERGAWKALQTPKQRQDEKKKHLSHRSLHSSSSHHFPEDEEEVVVGVMAEEEEGMKGVSEKPHREKGKPGAWGVVGARHAATWAYQRRENEEEDTEREEGNRSKHVFHHATGTSSSTSRDHSTAGEEDATMHRIRPPLKRSRSIRDENKEVVHGVQRLSVGDSQEYPSGGHESEDRKGPYKKETKMRGEAPAYPKEEPMTSSLMNGVSSSSSSTYATSSAHATPHTSSAVPQASPTTKPTPFSAPLKSLNRMQRIQQMREEALFGKKNKKNKKP